MKPTIMIASHRHDLGNDAAIRCLGYDRILVDGRGTSSCSQVWNMCVDQCPTETVIICNEKARPRQEHVKKVLELLDKGYGLVGLYRFGFFGFTKELMRRIGMFDERYIGGHHEDNDMILRLGEANIGYYESHEVPYIKLRSAWTHDRAIKHWEEKWEIVDGVYKRLLPEPDLLYNLGPSIRGVPLLPWSDSILLPMSGGHLNRSMVTTKE